VARPEKVAVVEEVREELTGNPATLFTEYRGLSVGALAELRGQLREAGARYLVVKNTLASIAARDAGFADLADVFTGPTALTFCTEDPVGPAKALRRFAKDHPELVVKGGLLDGRIVDAATAERLADLETREELLGRLAGLMHAALSSTASLLQAPLSKVARLVAALEDKGENPAGEPTEDVPAAAGEEPAGAEQGEFPGRPPEGDRAVDAARDAAAGAVAAAGDAVGGAVEAVGDTAEDALDAAAEVPEDAAEAAGDRIEAAGERVEAVGEAVGEAVEDVGERVEDAVEAAGEAVEDVAEVAGDAIKRVTAAAAGTVGSDQQGEDQNEDQNEDQTGEG
jgi:large subunit ribosomal protein L10